MADQTPAPSVRGLLPTDHHSATIEAFAESVEAMSPDEQAMFWRSLAEDAVRTLTVERNTYRWAVDALGEYKVALEWYADPMQTRAAFTADGGVRARAALKRVADDRGQFDG